MVVVERGAFFEAQLRMIAIVPILLEHRDFAVANCLDDPPYDGRFARAGTAGDADHEW
jgi:hypothetical protein